MSDTAGGGAAREPRRASTVTRSTRRANAVQGAA